MRQPLSQNLLAKWRNKADNWRMIVAAITAVLGGPRTLQRKVDANTDLALMTREGLPVNALTALAAELDLERKVLARVARVLAQARDTFGDPAKAVHWLKSPNAVMEGRTPLSLLDTDAGVKWVETILGRIDYGIFS
jgi:hypothetical protein